MQKKYSNVFLTFIKSLFVLLMIPFFVTACAVDQRSEIEKWGTRKDFSNNTQLFMIRPSSIAYSFSTAMITTIAERQKQLNKSVNIIQFLDASVWSYEKKSPVGNSFKYHFESYYEEYNDLLLPETNWNSEINIGLVSNLHDVTSSAPSVNMNVESIEVDDLKIFDDYVSQKTNNSKKYDLYIDDLLLTKLYWNRKMILYALLCRIDHLYVIPQGLFTNENSIIYQYYEYYEVLKNPQLSQNQKRKRWSDIFSKTAIRSSAFNDNFTLKFSGTESARKYSDLSIFLNYYDKITIFNFETKLLDSYSMRKQNILNVNNIYLDVFDFPKYFNLPLDTFKKIFFKMYFNTEKDASLDDCFFDDESRANFQSAKKNIIFLLGKEWSTVYLKENTRSETEANEIVSIFQKMMQKYQTLFDPEKYNYLFKGHPRQPSSELIASTKTFCTFTDSKITPIFFNPTIPMELIINVDLVNHLVDGEYALFNPNDYVNDSTSYKMCKGVYAGYYTHSTAIYTTMSFISQKISLHEWSGIYRKVIPPEIEFLMDDFRTDGISKSMGLESIYEKDISYDINLKFYQSAFENLIAIDHFPNVLDFKKFSNWVK